MGKKEDKLVKLTNLLINLENPRFDVLNDQREAISVMIKGQKEKIVNLAEDISKDGLDPTNLPIIIDAPSHSNTYIVLEGNRRIVALKILNNPELIPSDEQIIKKKIKNLSKRFRNSTEIKCMWFEDETEAYKWIELRHTGENNGVGTVNWTAIQKERFNIKRGKSSIVIQAVDFVEKEGQISEDVREKIKTMPITNFGRLLADPDVREELGVDIKDGNLVTVLPKEEVVKGLTKVAEDIATKRINVNDIYYKKDKIKYINNLDDSKKPKKDKKLSEAWNLADGKTSSKPTRSYPASTSRKKIISRNCKLIIPEKRVNNIFTELKRLNVDDFPNCGAVLLRVFLELSLDHYIENNSTLGITIDAKLHKKINCIADHFETNKIMSKLELKPIRQSVSKKNEIFSTETLNAYVHNKHLNPIPNDLKLTWDNIEWFIKNLWS
jgi:hypothetical protein